MQCLDALTRCAFRPGRLKRQEISENPLQVIEGQWLFWNVKFCNNAHAKDLIARRYSNRKYLHGQPGPLPA
jgi:hypothetical protein